MEENFEELVRRFKGFQKDWTKRKWQRNCENSWAAGIVMFICDVVEITDWFGEELTDKFIIQWEKTEMSAKTEIEDIEEPQE